MITIPDAKQHIEILAPKTFAGMADVLFQFAQDLGVMELVRYAAPEKSSLYIGKFCQSPDWDISEINDILKNLIPTEHHYMLRDDYWGDGDERPRFDTTSFSTYHALCEWWQTGEPLTEYQFESFESFLIGLLHDLDAEEWNAMRKASGQWPKDLPDPLHFRYAFKVDWRQLELALAQAGLEDVFAYLEYIAGETGNEILDNDPYASMPMGFDASLDSLYQFKKMLFEAACYRELIEQCEREATDNPEIYKTVLKIWESCATEKTPRKNNWRNP